MLSEGSSFKAGDNLAEIETEKITIEIPAQSAGKITKILVSEGSNVKVGEVIGEFADLDSNISIDANSLTLRSEEHTSELQSHHALVCRLLLEKK